MAHVIEPATSGRAKCRGCGRKIPKDEPRFGERFPNPYGEGEATLWFHPSCAAYKRPEPLLETLRADPTVVENGAALLAASEFGLEHRRLPRIDGAQRSPTGRARCRCCRDLIAKDDWRIALVFFDEARFQPSGFIHAPCAGDYFGTTDLIERVRHFSPELEPRELEALQALIAD